jgi:type VI secretion system protein ImpE
VAFQLSSARADPRWGLNGNGRIKMTGQELFAAGRLTEAIEALNAQVRSKPTDQDGRFMLFALLCFAGDLERAEKQLDVLANQDERARSGGLVYRGLLASELERRMVFSGEGRPAIPPGAPAYVDKRLAALALVRSGEYEAAEQRLDEAIAETPTQTGKLNGRAFRGIRDYDDALGSILEVFAGGRYLWIPLHHVRRLALGEPTTALDTLWLPAQLEDADGERARVHIPALYAGSHEHEDTAVRMGRRTEWLERGNLYAGAGQRIFLLGAETGTEELQALSLRSLEIADTG